MAKTTIQINTKTKALLQEEGKMGDTYDSLIIKLLNELHKLRNGSSDK